MIAPGIGTLAALGPFLEYLRPRHSPYLIMVTFGVVALVGAAWTLNENDRWWLVATPVLIVLPVLIFFTFLSRDESGDLDAEEFEGQLRFSRAMGLSIPMVSLSFGAIPIIEEDMFFFTHIAVCGFQIFIFTCILCFTSSSRRATL